MKPEDTGWSSNEPEFAVFCIENVAARLNVDAEKVYAALTEQTDILKEYIIPEYEVLHTQSKEYIVEDIIGSKKTLPIILKLCYNLIRKYEIHLKEQKAANGRIKKCPH